MEPQWNPMVESQALDRVHRLGQQRPVKTIRYVMKSSFDEVGESRKQFEKQGIADECLVAVNARTSENEARSCRALFRSERGQSRGSNEIETRGKPPRAQFVQSADTVTETFWCIQIARSDSQFNLMI